MPSPSAPQPPALRQEESRARITAEVLGAFALATAVAALLYRVRAVDDWFHVIVAVLFLYLPVVLLGRRDLARYGLTAAPLANNLALVAVLILVVFPAFFVGFALWQRVACALAPLRQLAPVACRPGGLLAHVALHLPPSLVDFGAAELRGHGLLAGLRALADKAGRNLLVAELAVVALPEEFFFRGYVQGRLAEAWPARRQFLGAPVGLALIVTAALFALCHVAVQGNPATLAVFFPGLVFGWMRARTGSILPGVIFHGLCNVYIETLNRSFGA